MEIPVGAEAHCADGPCGRLVYIILNPRAKTVTHVVVQEDRVPHTRRLVPIGAIVTSTSGKVLMRCTREELRYMEPFVEAHLLPSPVPRHDTASHLVWPYEASEAAKSAPSDGEPISVGELAIRQGIRVVAADGDVGWVERFLVDPATGHVTQLVVQGEQKGVAVSAREIERIEENIIYLRSYRSVLDAFPPVPTHKRQRYTTGFD